LKTIQEKLTLGWEQWLFFWMPVFAYCIVIFALSAQQKAISAPGIPSGDQLLHVVQYSILGFLMARAFFTLHPRRSQAVLLGVSIILSVLFAFSDEIHQFFVSGRTASLTDVMADGVGASIGTIVYWGWLGAYNGKAGRIRQQREREHLTEVEPIGPKKRR
jgi:VanZ family protein